MPNVEVVEKRTPRQTAAVNLKHVGMKGQLLETGQLFEVDVGRKVYAVFVHRALLFAPRGIAQPFANVGNGKLDTLLLKGVRQQAERRFFDGTFAGVRVCRFQIVGFLVFLCPRYRDRDGTDQEGEKQIAHHNTKARRWFAAILQLSTAAATLAPSQTHIRTARDGLVLQSGQNLRSDVRD
jgi:hypothetical protein